MNNKAIIKLWGSEIGYATLGNDGYVSFEYTDNFINSNIQVSPLKMPLSRVVYCFRNLDKNVFHGLPGLLYESLPDKYGNKVIDNYLQSIGKDQTYFNIIDRLCYIGTRGMGALTFEPPTNIKDDDKKDIHVDELVEFAKSILEKKKKISFKSDDKELIKKLFSISSSAGGARAKALIAINNKTKQIKSGQIELDKNYEYYIIKFDGLSNNGDYNLEDDIEYTKIEYAYYLMAREAHINISDSFLLNKDNKSHFVTKRFDRVNGERIHMQSYASLAHINFNEPCLASYEQLASDTRKITKNQNDIEELYRRMVFNVLAVNNDDHVKNFSFLMNKKGEWRLSPAYDITFAYNPSNHWLKAHQMTINGKNNDINYDDVIKAGKAMGVSKIKANRIIQEVKLAISKFKDIASKLKINKDTIDYIYKLINDKIIKYE